MHKFGTCKRMPLHGGDFWQIWRQTCDAFFDKKSQPCSMPKRATAPRKYKSRILILATFTLRGWSLRKKEKNQKKIPYFLVPNPRPGPDGLRASGWYGQLHEPISPLSLLNSYIHTHTCTTFESICRDGSRVRRTCRIYNFDLIPAFNSSQVQ